MSVQTKEKGFTLIELVIVLAIAALILAGILLAVGGAQRSQRDSNRKNVASRMATALENYASNHDGTYDGFACNTTTYCNGIQDPDNSTGLPVVRTAATNATATSGVQVNVSTSATSPGFTCNGINVIAGTTPRQYAISYWSENANSPQCTSNK